jgi:hypothetical protein
MALPLLVDNDAILKLSACNLLHEALTLLGCMPQEAMVLDAARHAFRKRRDRQRPQDIQEYTLAGLERAVIFAENAIRIQEAPDPSIQEVLASIPNVDPEGDLILVDRAYALKDAILLTGDKRCIRAIAKNEPTRFIYDSLVNRVVCLEAVIRALMTAHGFEHIRDCVVPVTECDTALKVIFGSGKFAQHANVQAAIEGYITDLERDVGVNWLRHL